MEAERCRFDWGVGVGASAAGADGVTIVLEDEVGDVGGRVEEVCWVDDAALGEVAGDCGVERCVGTEDGGGGGGADAVAARLGGAEGRVVEDEVAVGL